MGQLVDIGPYTFDADRVLSIGPCGSAYSGQPDITRSIVNVNMGDWTATYTFDAGEYPLETIREIVKKARTPIGGELCDRDEGECVDRVVKRC